MVPIISGDKDISSTAPGELDRLVDLDPFTDDKNNTVGSDHGPLIMFQPF